MGTFLANICKNLFYTIISLLALSGVLIFFHHQGLALKFILGTFLLLVLASAKYLIDLQSNNRDHSPGQLPKLREYFFSFAILFIILLSISWQWVLPGPRVANDFPLNSLPTLKSLLAIPQTWSENYAEGFGHYDIFSLWSYPINLIVGSLGHLNIGFPTQERLLYIIPFTLLGLLSVLKFSHYLKLSRFASLIFGVVYLANSYILLVIDGGQMLIALAYSFFPLAILAVQKGINGRFRDKLLSVLAVCILGFLDIRFIFILALFFVTHLFFEKEKFLRYVQVALVTSLIFLGLNAYWIIVYLASPPSQEIFATLTKTNFIPSLNLGHAILLLSPHWFKNVFGQITPLRWEFMFLPILAFAAPLFSKRYQQINFWFVLSVGAIFLTKGASDPLGQVYPWLFQHVPGFSLFRDSTKFFFLIALSYAALIALVLDALLAKITRGLRPLIVFMVIAYLLLLIWPVFLDRMTGTLSEPIFQKDYQKVASTLEADKDFSRVFWIPFTQPLTYSDPNHPIVEAIRALERRPFAAGVLGTYETFNFLREAPYMGEIFDISGIGYLAYPALDKRRDDLHPDHFSYYHKFLNQINNLSWVEKADLQTNVPLIKTKKHQDKIFLTQNSWWVIGSDDIYRQATTSADLSLSKNALIFAEEAPDLSQKLLNLPSLKIVFKNKGLIDLAASFINSDQFIFPAKNLSRDPNQTGWWKRETKDLIDWRYFLRNKYGLDNLDFDYGGGWAVAEGNLRLEIQNKNTKKDQILLARVFESTRSGQLVFYQGQNQIGETLTNRAGNNFHWIEVGKLKDTEPITIQSAGDINVVNALAVLKEDEWENFQSKASELKPRVFDYSDKNTQTQNAKVNFQQISPTKYIVTIQNLVYPSMLVFADSYDAYWKLNGQTAVPVYSMLNGFYVQRDGQYNLEYEPQKYVYPGLLVTGITVIIFMILFLSLP